MRIEEKKQLIENLSEQLSKSNILYVADISNLNAEDTSNLRRLCFKKDIKLTVVKNTLLKQAMEKTGKDYHDLFEILSGPTSIMLSDTGNAPAKLIKEFRRTSDRPILKGAYIEDVVYLGDDQLEALVNIKSKEELIGDIIALLQSPAKNVISGLMSGGNKLSGILKTLSEKSE